jgi:hypothetical protein
MYLKQLNYNHTGTQFFETKPNSSMLTLMETAKSEKQFQLSAWKVEHILNLN